MRRYADPVEVRRGATEGVEGPEQFLWRGRLWKVRAVLAHWVETGPWWHSATVRAVIGAEDGSDGTGPGVDDGGASWSLGELITEREMWRVEAARGASYDGGGVFDLCFDWADGSWQLVGCVD